MFDIWWGDIELTRLALILSVVIFLPVQLLLCFKVKSRTIRLLPIIAFSLLILVNVLMAIVTEFANRIAFALFALLSGIVLITCGIGWGIWAIVNLKQKKKDNEQVNIAQ